MAKRAASRHISETTGWQRLLLGAVLGGVVAAMPWPVGFAFRSLLGWCAGVGLYLLLAWWLCLRFDADNTRLRAQAQDEPTGVLLLLMLIATLASLGAIGAMVLQADDQSGLERAMHLLVGMAALAFSWLFIHTVFAFRYAHRYYERDKEEQNAAPEGPGLVFPGQRDPAYFDFLYHAMVIGMTFQVSDVQVISREMRFLTLVHSVVAFAFNMLVVALSINVASSLLK